MSKLSLLYSGLLVVVWAVACSSDDPAPKSGPDLGSSSAPLSEDGGTTSDAG
jgi:hypothetical protein